MTRSIQELTIRRTFCDLVIRELMKSDSPLAPKALAEYHRQLAVLDAELTEAYRLYRQAQGLPEPEPVVVGVQPARLFGEARGNHASGV